MYGLVIKCNVRGGVEKLIVNLPDIRLVYFSGLYDLIKDCLLNKTPSDEDVELVIRKLTKIYTASLEKEPRKQCDVDFLNLIKQLKGLYKSNWIVTAVLERNTCIERDTRRSTRPKPVPTGKYDRYGNPYYYPSAK